MDVSSVSFMCNGPIIFTSVGEGWREAVILWDRTGLFLHDNNDQMLLCISRLCCAT